MEEEGDGDIAGGNVALVNGISFSITESQLQTCS